jgi:hypothetical protein
VELVNLIKAKTQHKSAGQRLEPAQILVDMHGRRLQRFMMQERGYILAVPLVSPKVLHCGKQHFFLADHHLFLLQLARRDETSSVT